MTIQAKGPRGDTRVHPHDLTGKTAMRLRDEKEERGRIIARTIADLSAGDDVVIVPVPGGRSHAVSREVVRYLQAK